MPNKKRTNNKSNRGRSSGTMPNSQLFRSVTQTSLAVPLASQSISKLVALSDLVPDTVAVTGATARMYKLTKVRLRVNPSIIQPVEGATVQLFAIDRASNLAPFTDAKPVNITGATSLNLQIPYWFDNLSTLLDDPVQLAIVFTFAVATPQAKTFTMVLDTTGRVTLPGITTF